jgi:protease IV
MKNFFKMVLATIVGVVFSSLIMFFILAGIIGALVATGNTPVVVKPNSILKLTLDKPIVDRTQNNPLAGLNFHGLGKPKQDGLNDILDNIKKAKNDKNIKGIYLEITVIPAGIATIEEIRNALIDFKKSGKFILAYADFYTQRSYYLSSVADQIYMNPKGGIEFLGMRSQMMFYKGTFEKLGIEVQVFKHGKFKSYPEPYVNDKMSVENKLQISQLLNSIWDYALNGISKQRGITVNNLNSLADRMVLMDADSCIANKLVDSLFYKDQINDKLIKLSGQSAKEPEFISLAKYERVQSSQGDNGKAKFNIAVVYAQGDIVMGKEEDDEISSDKISKALRDARKDTTVKAIVFRVNSPGGSSLASEVIWREVELAVKEKPVVVSMGDVAASGGYYISCPANTIVTSSNTITGSIGVFGIIPNVSNFFSNKLGITTDVAKTNKHSDFPTIYHAMNPEEKAYLQFEIDKIYDDFVTHVSNGRKLTKTEIDQIGEGRVWSGSDAIKIGLADTVGGLDDAIKIAAQRARLINYNIKNLPEIEETFAKFIKSISDDTKSGILNSELGEEYKYFQLYKKVLHMKGIQARLPYEIEIY